MEKKVMNPTPSICVVLFLCPEHDKKLLLFYYPKTIFKKGANGHGKSFHGMVAEKLCLLVSVDTGRGREAFLKMV
jgi:hypothetical protein